MITILNEYRRIATIAALIFSGAVLPSCASPTVPKTPEEIYRITVAPAGINHFHFQVLLREADRWDEASKRKILHETAVGEIGKTCERVDVTSEILKESSEQNPIVGVIGNADCLNPIPLNWLSSPTTK